MSKSTIWVCALGLGFAICHTCSTTCRTAEPENATRPRELSSPQNVNPPRIVAGEIRGVPNTAASRIKCSEVLDAAGPMTIETIRIYRSCYVVDPAKQSFSDAASSLGVPNGSARGGRSIRVLRGGTGWSEDAGQFFDGKSEIVLATWECRLPPTKDFYVVTSLAVLRLSDGRHVICHFRPLMFANGNLLTRTVADEASVTADEKKQSSPRRTEGH